MWPDVNKPRTELLHHFQVLESEELNLKHFIDYAAVDCQLSAYCDPGIIIGKMCLINVNEVLKGRHAKKADWTNRNLAIALGKWLKNFHETGKKYKREHTE